MKIYTRKGDDGLTQLSRSYRTPKFDLIFHLLGELDLLSVHIGNCINFLEEKQNISSFTVETTQLRIIQNWIMLLNSHYYQPEKYPFNNDGVCVKRLEDWIDTMDEELPKLKNFILPSGELHLSRAITRKCERLACQIGTNEKNIIPFLNRLSDYLFTMGRWIDKQLGKTEELFLV